jgi:putative membrane protein
MTRRPLLATGTALLAMTVLTTLPPDAAAQQQQLQTVPTESTASPSSVPPADLAFVLRAAMGGMEEVALGELAQQKAQAPEVKELAGLIAREHTMANEELMQVAGRKGIQVPETTDPVTQTVAASLSELNGPDFDLQYVLQQHGAHLAAVQLFQHATQHALDPDVRAFAQKYGPKIEAHTGQIEEIGLAMMKGMSAPK